jgi:hypothetical protein
MLRFLKYFRRKKLAFLTHNKAKLCKKFYHNIGFGENANFFAKNWKKSQKIVIITLTPGESESPNAKIL